MLGSPFEGIKNYPKPKCLSEMQQYDQLEGWSDSIDQGHFNLFHQLNKNIHKYEKKYTLMNPLPKIKNSSRGRARKLSQNFKSTENKRTSTSSYQQEASLELPMIGKIEIEDRSIARRKLSLIKYLQENQEEKHAQDHQNTSDSEIFKERTSFLNNSVKLQHYKFGHRQARHRRKMSFENSPAKQNKSNTSREVEYLKLMAKEIKQKQKNENKMMGKEQAFSVFKSIEVPRKGYRATEKTKSSMFLANPTPLHCKKAHYDEGNHRRLNQTIQNPNAADEFSDKGIHQDWQSKNGLLNKVPKNCPDEI